MRTTLVLVYIALGLSCAAHVLPKSVKLVPIALEVTPPQNSWAYWPVTFNGSNANGFEFSLMRDGKGKAVSITTYRREVEASAENRQLELEMEKVGPKDLSNPAFHKKIVSCLGKKCLRCVYYFTPTNSGMTISCVAYVFVANGLYYHITAYTSGLKPYAAYEDEEVKAILGSLKFLPDVVPSHPAEPASPSRAGSP